MSAPANRRDLVALPGAARPDRIGQGTAVEQSRASAEVFAAVLAADQRPRDEERAIRRRDTTCQRKRTAEAAFFAYPRGGKQVTGPTVHLARDLASCWGNIQYGITELRRDDVYGQSEMQAWAWDLESNTRNSSTFIVPHTRHTSDSVSVLTDPRDIYENNANAGARRLRECILAVIPRWYVEGAIDSCHKTLRSEGDTKPLPERRAQAIRLFDELGVGEGRLVAHRGKSVGQWTETDMAQLMIAYRTVDRGEARAEDVFPPDESTVAGEDVAPARPQGADPRPKGQRPPADSGSSDGAEEPAPASPADQPATQWQTEFPAVAGSGDDPPPPTAVLTSIGKKVGKVVTADAARKAVVARMAGLSRPVGSTSELTGPEALQVSMLLSDWEQRGVLTEQIQAVAVAVADQSPPDPAKPGTKTSENAAAKPEESIPDADSDPEGWHKDGHPRRLPTGEISRVPNMSPDACQWCAP